MEKEFEILSIEEQKLISRALLEVVNRFPELKEGMTASYQFLSDKDPLAVFSMQGAVKLEEYLCLPGDESFDGQFPFFIRYRSKPSNTPQRMARQAFLDNLGEWLERQEYPPLTNGRTITEIKRTSTTFQAERLENGMEDYQLNFNLIYEKR